MSKTQSQSPVVAYFSMEVIVDPATRTCNGGLGILTGDLLRSAEERRIPTVAVTLLHRKSCFHRQPDASGNQLDGPCHGTPEEVLDLFPACISVDIKGREGGGPVAYATVIRSTIAPNGSFFTSQRMLSQYVRNRYICTAE